VVFILLLFLCGSAYAATPPAEFAEHVIASSLKGGYQVVIADLNKDGKPDIIALASGMTELVWFENPEWKRHVLATELSHMINLAVWDTDGDGIPEIVLAHEFANQAKNSLGIVSVLQHGPDPRQPWKVTEIDRIPTSHRLRWADIYGDGKKVLVNSPLTGAKAEAPEYRGKTPVVFYKPGVWMRETIPLENEGVAHGIYITDWDSAGRDDILTASFVGLDLFRLGKNGVWTRTELAKGDPSAWPKGGSSDVTVGWLGKTAKTRFMAAIEPWHGNLVSVYRQDSKGVWQRQVIDDALVEGHTILTADLNGDGNDEIVAGYRGAGRSVNIYYANSSKGERWMKHPLDNGGIAASSCAVADLNADGRPDIACIGSATANLKWYENKGPKK
jgi:hypothetical protein